MSRVYNFSAGPAVLPEEVLKEVADEMMDYNGTGMSVMERQTRSHLLRTKLSAISRTAVICRSARMQTMYTSVRITPFTAQNSKNFQTQKARLW